jgi:starvation-inducible DNA-binding protein
MDELVEALKRAFADSFSFYLKAHGYHWNVEGVLFSQFHRFFGKIYEEVFDNLDSFAEEIRSLDSYAPFTFQQFDELSSVKGVVGSTDALAMTSDLLSANQLVIESLEQAFKLADQLNKQGIADFIAARIDAHEKHGWMLRSTLK